MHKSLTDNQAFTFGLSRSQLLQAFEKQTSKGEDHFVSFPLFFPVSDFQINKEILSQK